MRFTFALAAVVAVEGQTSVTCEDSTTWFAQGGANSGGWDCERVASKPDELRCGFKGVEDGGKKKILASVACPKACGTCEEEEEEVAIPAPTAAPTRVPTLRPTYSPGPTAAPTAAPTYSPTAFPTFEPTPRPTVSPQPTSSPTITRYTVACAGDSITAAYWPGMLEELLNEWKPAGIGGLGISVLNFGRSGSTVTDTDRAYKSYARKQYDRLLAATFDVCILTFGTNDAKREYWDDTRRDYVTDYRKLIDEVRASQAGSGRDPVVLLGVPVPYGLAGFSEKWGDDASWINEEIPKMLYEGLAGDVDGFVPFNAAGLTGAHYDDAIHPNEAGHELMARVALDAVVSWQTRAPTT